MIILVSMKKVIQNFGFQKNGKMFINFWGEAVVLDAGGLVPTEIYL